MSQATGIWIRKILQTKTARGICAFFFIAIIYLILFTTHTDNYIFLMTGGFVGAFSAAIVVGGNYAGNTGQSFRLLIWRACCDFAIGVRYILIPVFNTYVCDGTSCTFTANETYCQFPSFILEFFTIASEAWFFCNGLDLYFTVTNPFSDFQARLKTYHMFAWCLAIFLSVLPFIINMGDTIYGFWYVSRKVPEDNICWLKIENEDRLGWPIWIFFFCPLCIFYLSCVLSLWVAYNRLRKGLTKSFLPRLKLLVTNTTNVFVLSLYWLVFLFIYSLSFFSRNYQPSNRTLWNILNFTLASKGFSSLIVWILSPDTHTGDKKDEGEEGVDANKSLREEVLQFATAGIRSTARAGANVGPHQARLVRRPPAHRAMDRQTVITPLFFLRFMMGEDKELAVVQNMVQNRTSVFRRNSSQIAIPSPSFANIRPSTFEEGDDMRLSQRPTIVTVGRTNTNQSYASDEFGSVITVSSNNGTYSQGQQQRAAPSAAEYHDEEEDRDSDVEYVHNKQSQQSHKRSSASNNEPFRAQMSTASSTAQSGMARSDLQPSDRGTEVESVGRVSDMVDVQDEMSEKLDDNLSGWNFSGHISRFFTNLYADSDIVEFTEFQPYHFRRVRIAAGITDEIYINEFSTTIKERLTQGGASGAFFFFSKGENFIAKSCTAEEVNTLEKNACAYADHMVSHSKSFISKILGAYKLTIYGNALYFFVMNNLFYNTEGLTMNEKYDIKGSWVSRNAEPPIEGQSANCSYCEQKFIYQKQRRKAPAVSAASASSRSNKTRHVSTASHHSQTNIEMGVVSPPQSSSPTHSHSKSIFSPMLSDITMSNVSGNASTIEECLEAGGESSMQPQQRQCPYTVNGQHEPNVILKDNDIKYKIRLNRETTEELFNQIKSDAEFLYSIGIMDYSLLVGVHNTEYMVKDEHVDTPVSGPKLVRHSSFKRDDGDEHESPESPHAKLLAKLTNRSNQATRQSVSNESKSDTASLALTKKVEVLRVVGPDAYFFGIIDFQQEWNLKKQMERFFKVHFRGADPNGLSAIEPRIYKERFLRKVEDILDFESFNRGNGSG